MPVKFIDIIRPSIGQGTFGELPNSLIRIEFRRIGGKPLEPESGDGPAQGTHGIPFVDLAVVPKHDHRPPEVPQELTEEVTGFRLANVLPVELVIEADPAASRADRNPGDHRDSVATVAVVMNRCLAAGGPGAPHPRNQQGARFVNEDEVGPQPCSVFFTRDQSVFFHCAIRSSSRSRARRSGFCGLHPRPCIKRPTWSGW